MFLGSKYYIIFAEEILYTAFVLCINVKITFSTLLLILGLRKYLTCLMDVDLLA